VRIGILGGTFNPPHLGHLICAQEAYVALQLDAVTLMPARIPPHKPVEDEPGPGHRYELCRLAVEDDERMTVADLEIGRPGTSYTIDTLDQLRTRDPDSELFLIVGGDIAAGLPRWREPERVLDVATLAVAKRGGTPRTEVQDALAGLAGAERTRFFPMPRIGISSTEIRRRVAIGDPIRYLVPEAVAGYIERQGLYR
jgi:nicotinate-nucleotide adenylyltransferase